MTLFTAIIVFASLLLVFGGLLLSGSPAVASACKGFPRAKVAGYVLFGVGCAWFLWNVAHLSQADEIGFLSKDMMLLVFVAIAVLSVPFVPDFLSVRGLAIVYLLSARVFLDAGWLEYSTPQRMFNAAVYVGIVGALIIGASPFRLRDFFEWLFAKRSPQLLLGAGMVVYGLALAGGAFVI